MPVRPAGAGRRGRRRAGDVVADLSDLQRGPRFIDLFNKGKDPIDWKATASQPWLKLDRTEGRFTSEHRLWVSIDWDRAPRERNVKAAIDIASNAGNRQIVVPVFNPAEPARDAVTGFVESHGYVSMEAEHFTRRRDRNGVGWRVIEGLGRSGDSVAVFPPTVDSHADPATDRHAARRWNTTCTCSPPGALVAHRLPAHATRRARRGVRLAIGIDGGEPRVLGDRPRYPGDVLANLRRYTTTVTIDKPDRHTLTVWMVDPGVVIDKIVVYTEHRKTRASARPNRTDADILHPRKTMRTNLSAMMCLLATLGGWNVRCPAAETAKPNIVYLLADQWRASATGYAGDPNVKTPNLDRLAKEGLNFRNAVSVCPVCTPYRAALMTGRYPTSTGMFLNDAHLPDSELCIAEVLKAAGYATAYIGKWHLDGHGRSSYIPPERRQGWDYWKAAECDHNYNHSHYYTGNSDEKRFWEGYDAFAQTKDAQTVPPRPRARPTAVRLVGLLRRAAFPARDGAGGIPRRSIRRRRSSCRPTFPKRCRPRRGRKRRATTRTARRWTSASATCCRRWTRRASPTTRSSCSPPTTARCSARTGARP